MARKEVLERIVRLIEDEYVFPDRGRKIIDRIRKNEKNYLLLRSDRKFAELITADLFRWTKDRHFTLTVRNKRTSRSSPIAKTKVDKNAIAMITIFRFPSLHSARGKEVIREIDSAFRKAESARALVIDIRKNAGGDGSSVALATSYLLPPKPQLLVWYRYRLGTPQGESWSWERLPGERKARPRPLADKPVAILVSKDTFSAAEEFAYTLQQMKRATIIGEQTKGGAHPSKRHILEEKFVLSLPIAETISPYTNRNWEGEGVEPDIPSKRSGTTEI